MDQEVPGSRPGGGTITFNRLSPFHRLDAIFPSEIAAFIAAFA